MIPRLPSPRLTWCVLAVLLSGTHAPGAEEKEETPPPHAPAPANLILPKGTAAPAAEALADPGIPAAKRAEKSPKATEASAAAGEAHSLLRLGAELGDRGEFGAAEIAFRQILNERNYPKPEQTEALLGLARLYRKKSEFTRAAAVYEKFLKEYPSDERVPEALLELGRTHRALGAHKLAVSRFYAVINSTLKLSGDGFDRYQLLARTAQFEIAETHYAAGDFAEAAKFFSRLRLLDLAPQDRARAHFKSACAQQLGGDAEGAVTTLRAYLEQWPDDENVPEARYLLATTLRQLGRTQDALASTLQLLRTEQSRVAVDSKRWIYWQRRTGNQLANDFFQSGDTLNALAVYHGLNALSPEPIWRLPVSYQIALCYERMRMTDRARSAYQSVIDGAKANPAEEAANRSPLPPELEDLARMATWRLEHLEWRDQPQAQVSTLLVTKTGHLNDPVAPAGSPSGSAAPALSSPATNPPHDANGNPAEPPATLR